MPACSGWQAHVCQGAKVWHTWHATCAYWWLPGPALCMPGQAAIHDTSQAPHLQAASAPSTVMKYAWAPRLQRVKTYAAWLKSKGVPISSETQHVRSLCQQDRGGRFAHLLKEASEDNRESKPCAGGTLYIQGDNQNCTWPPSPHPLLHSTHKALGTAMNVEQQVACFERGKLMRKLVQGQSL